MSRPYYPMRPWPLPFKAAGKPPVKGGRWSIRRDQAPPYGYVNQNKPWRAWTNGSAARFNRRFETQQQAIEHATLVANTFANPTPENVERMIRFTMPWISDDSVRSNVERYAVIRSAPAPVGFRWVACSSREFYSAVSSHRHLMPEGGEGVTTVCGITGLGGVWRRSSKKPDCPTCLARVSETGRGRRR